jgi:hypothetical protein
MSKKSIITFLVAVLVGIVLIAVIPLFIRASRVSGAYPCVNNLRVISAAKDQWALENNKTTRYANVE